MPNAKTHLIIGGATGAAVNVAIQFGRMAVSPEAEFDWGELATCVAVGGIAGLVPDLIEPASSPNHRGFFHSLTAAALVAFLITGKHTGKWSAATLTLLSAAGFAYISHLVADATTPKCIDLI